MAAATRTKKRKQAAMEEGEGSQQLPDELLEEILARLPAKSVGRLRCVSRSWAATLSSASFVDLHLRRANPPGRPKVFLVPGASSSPAYDLFAWQGPAGDRVERLMRLRGGIQPEMLLPVTAKPCRGLVLLRFSPTLSYYVCNPSTGALLPVPDTRLDLGGGVGSRVAYGLGYSAAAGEHKLARLLCFARHGATVAARCEVLVLGASSAHWRPSAGAGRAPVCEVSEDNAAAFLDGRLHFAGRGGTIVTFDVADETFGALAPPADYPETGSPCLTELGGCLCVTHGLAERGEPYTIWLLRDYAAARWEKLCCIDQAAWPDADLWTSVVPVEIYHEPTTRRGKIMFMTSECKVLAADLERDGGARPDVLFSPDIVEAAMGGCGGGFFPSRLGLYEESLVTPGRTTEEIIFSAPPAAAWAEVLKRLPARTVARLNLVCRAWRAMIGTDRFVASHAAHAQLNTTPRIMFAHHDAAGRFTALDDVINGPSSGTPPLMPLGTKFACSSLSCLGLVVCAREGDNYAVCNPCTGQGELTGELRTVRGLARAAFGSVLDASGEGEATLFAGRVGLGYDDTAGMNKHMLVYLSYSHRSFATRQYELECVVQNIHDCMRYKLERPPPRPVANAPPVNVAGRMFWLVDPRLGDPTPPGTCCEIVAMDNGACGFEVLRGPPCSRDDDDEPRVSVLELRGALGVASAHRVSNTLEIWAMRRGSGGGGSWSMECSIELGEFSLEYSSVMTVPLAMDPGGRIFLSTGRSLGWYDPRTRAMQTVYRIIDWGSEVDVARSSSQLWCTRACSVPTG